jgi:diadenosine tetraphosphate (Ap4A) HIT family hydrolase
LDARGLPTTLIHERVAQARAGVNPAVVARLGSGWVVMGDHQMVPGYCLLLPDPVVATLNDLDAKRRQQFLADMVAIGDALLAVTDAVRINYEMLGNVVPALHAHVTPRYAWESEPFRSQSAFSYDRSAAAPFDPAAHADLMSRIAAALRSAGATD